MPNDPTNPYAPHTGETSGHFQEGTQLLATRGQRFLGSLIDLLTMLPVIFIGSFLFGGISLAVGIDPTGILFRIVGSVFGLVLGLVGFLVIHGYLLATRGQTVGKMVMKTQIVSDQGGLVPFGPLFIKRYLVIALLSSLPVIGMLVGLVNALAIFRDNHKCLHDEIAGTRVIQLRQ